MRAGAATVTAVMVVNALGDVWDGERGEWVARSTPAMASASPGNTTIGAVLTDAKLGREAIRRVAVTAHDGLGRAIRPAHTDFDGDTIFSLAYGDTEASTVEVQAAATTDDRRAGFLVHALEIAQLDGGGERRGDRLVRRAHF